MKDGKEKSMGLGWTDVIRSVRFVPTGEGP